jgi:cell division protein FtsQ
MRDLQPKKQRLVPHNRVKKAPKKRKPVNWRPIVTWISRGSALVAVCAAVGTGGWQLYRLVSHTTLLRLERIEVSPTRKLSRGEVVAIAGVKPGDPMLSLKLKGMVEQLSKNPWVEQAQVRRYFPHTLSITLSERTPQAVANVGCLYYLDAKGELFKSLAEGDRLDYPLITGVTQDDLEKDPAGSKEAFKNALALIETLRGGKVFGLEEVSEIHYDKGYGFTLFTMQGGVPVKVGNSGFGDKLTRLSGIYNDLKPQMQGLDYIDLDYSDKIIVKKA